MITFKQFLYEKSGDDIVQYLRTHCLQAVQDCVEADGFFYRGMKRRANTYRYVHSKDGEQRDIVIQVESPRTDRRPRDTPAWAHRVIDDFFEKEFGARLRSSSLMVFNNEHIAGGYGEANVILPMEKYSAYWSPAVTDLTTDLFPHLEPGGDNEEALPGDFTYWMKRYETGPGSVPTDAKETAVREIMADYHYKKTDGAEALKHAPGETMIECEDFLAIPYGHVNKQWDKEQLKELFYEVASE